MRTVKGLNEDIWWALNKAKRKVHGKIVSRLRNPTFVCVYIIIHKI